MQPPKEVEEEDEKGAGDGEDDDKKKSSKYYTQGNAELATETPLTLRKLEPVRAIVSSVPRPPSLPSM